jgi:hypothetical protein
MRGSMSLGVIVLCSSAAVLSAAAMAGGCGGRPAGPAAGAGLPPVGPGELRPPEAFAFIASPAERSRALFLEASRVMLHPRCVNCHPAGDSPAQGDRGELHEPPVLRGPDDHGIVGLECTSCHQDRNLELARVPGAEKWALAPIEMAWVGRTPHAICEQVKDPARNGGKTLARIVEHSAHDPLVAWGWAPGAGRTPAPGTQERFGALMGAWAETGAECPREERGQ